MYGRKRSRRRQARISTKPDITRAVLVGLQTPEHSRLEVEDSLDELGRLGDTYGLEIGRRWIQTRKTPSPATYIGKGKGVEIAEAAREDGVGVLLFDDDLTPGQNRNLEKLTGLRIMDRCELILEIFRRNARTYEAKIQVELAQLQYMLPRLTHAWSHFTRQRAAVQMRGAGETQLEMDRRLVRKRIRALEKKLEEIGRQRKTRREGRPEGFRVALVGYTNSGKSTLMNRLTDSEVLVEDRLFATLDSTVRHITPTDNPNMLITDTVGFIRKLPHSLIASFKSTLEEVHVADVLLHVVDLSDRDFKQKIEYTIEVLHEIGCDEKRRILVFNKIDLLDQPSKLPSIVRSMYEGSICVSGHTGENIEELKDQLYRFFYDRWNTRELELSYDRADLVSVIYQDAKVESVEYRPEHILVKFRCSDSEYHRIETLLGLPAA